MKKITSIILSLFLLLPIFSFSVNAGTLTYNGYEYRVINDKYVELICCKSISKEYINSNGWYNIPSEINGMEVKYIGDSCFSYDLDVYNLDKVVIPDTVEYIGNNAFKRPFYDGGSSFELSWVNNIKLPNNVIFIGEGAFTQCDFEEITIPSSVKYLGSKAFEACSKLEKVHVKAELKNLLYSTFGYCSKLKTVEFPESVKSIGDYAFYGCTSLKSLTVPDNVILGKNSIGYYSKSGVNKKVSGFALNIKASSKLKSYPQKTHLNVVYVINASDSNYYDFDCEVGSEFKVRFIGDSIVSCKSSSSKTVKASAGGKITMLKNGSSQVKVTLKSGKKFTLSVGDDDMGIYPRLEKKNAKGNYVKIKSITLKKKKSVSLRLKGKVYGINNVYTNTKKAKITSKKSAETIKIRGLKKGKTTLKIKVNGVKTIKLKVKVK